MDILKKAAALLLTVEEHGDSELSAYRIKKCEGCNNFNPEKRQCKICLCFMDTKTTLATNRNPKKLGRVEITHCPVGNWGDKVVSNLYRKQDGLELLV